MAKKGKKLRNKTGETIMRFRQWPYSRPMIVTLITVVIGYTLVAIWPSLKILVWVVVLGILGRQAYRAYRIIWKPQPGAELDATESNYSYYDEPYQYPDSGEAILRAFQKGDMLYEERLHWLELEPALPRIKQFAGITLAVIIVGVLYSPSLLAGIPAVFIAGALLWKACSDWWYGRLRLTFVDYEVRINKPRILGSQGDYGVKTAHIELADHSQSDWERWLGLNSCTIRVGTKVQEDDPRITTRVHVKDGKRLDMLLNAFIDKSVSKH